MSTQPVRFDGEIFGVGTSSGARLVVGAWSESPFGDFVDVMVEGADGHRTLIAPQSDIADFIAATYVFDEIRIEPTTLHQDGDVLRVRSTSLDLAIVVGRRTVIGRILGVVPGPLRRARWWCRAIGPAARLLRPGVRTVGTAGGGRREYYCAADEHLIDSVEVAFDGVGLGGLRSVRPAVRFGFASTPPTPARVRVTTCIYLPR